MLLDPRIKSIWATDETASPKGFRRVAMFDLAFGDFVTVHDWRLIHTPSGAYHAYAPDLKNGTHSADLAPIFRDKIAELAVIALENLNARIASAAA